jgi:hypothetical protein
VPFVLERYKRTAPTPLDPYIEQAEEAAAAAKAAAEAAAAEAAAFAAKNKRTTAGIALGILVVGMFLTSINRRKRAISLGSASLS